MARGRGRGSMSDYIPDIDIEDFSSEMLDNIEAAGIKNKDRYAEIMDILPAVTEQLEKQERIEERLIRDNKKEGLPVIKSIKYLQTQILESNIEQLANNELIGTRQYEELDNTQQLLDLKKIRNTLEKNKINLDEISYNYETELLNELEQRLNVQQKINNLSNKFNEYAAESITLVDDLFTKTTGFLDNMPGGEWISKLVKTEDIKSKFLDNFKNKVKDNTEALLSSMVDTEKQGLSMFEKLKVGIKSFSESLMSIKTGAILLGVGLIIVALIGLVKLGNKLNEESIRISKSLGVTSNEAGNLHDKFNAIAIESGEARVNVETLTDAASQLNKEYGLLNDISKEQLKTQILLTEEFGFAEGNAFKLQEYAANSQLTSQDYLTTVGLITKQLNKQTKLQINYRDIIEDISDVATSIKNTFGSNIPLLVANVYQARLLGSSLNELQGVAENLMNIESSISSEMEARILTGKNLNFQQARGLAIQGKYAEMQLAILEQAGSLAKFQGQLPIFQEAEAAAAGMTVDQYTKLLQRAAILDKYNLRSSLVNGNISDETYTQLQNKIKAGDVDAQNMLLEYKRESNTKRFTALQEKLTQTAMRLLPFAEKFATKLTDIIVNMTEWLGQGNRIENVTNSIFSTLKLIVKPIEWIVKGLSSIYDFLTKIPGLGSTTAGVLTGMMGIIGFKSIKGIAGGFTNLFKNVIGGGAKSIITKMGGGGLIEKMFPSKGADIATKNLKKVGSGFSNVIKNIADSLTHIAKGIANSLVAIVKGITTSLTAIFKAAGTIVDTIVKTITTNLVKVVKSLSDSLVTIAKGIGSSITIIVKSLSDSLVMIAEALENSLTTIVDSISESIETLAESIGSGIKDILVNAGEGLAGFFKAFETVKTGDLIKGAAALIIMSGSLWVFAKAIKEFINVSWDSVGMGIASLAALTIATSAIGKVTGDIIIGAAAMVIMAGAVGLFGLAMGTFTDVEWDTVLKAVVALTVLTVAIVALGILMSSGVGALAIVAGALAMGIMAGALWVLGKAMQEFGKATKEFIPFFEMISSAINSGITAIGNMIEKVVLSIGTATSMIIDSIIRLSSVDVLNLLAIGPALAGIAGGLTLLSAVSIGSSIGGFLTGGGNIFDKLIKLSTSFKDTSISIFANSFKQLETIQYDYIITQIERLGDTYSKIRNLINDNPINFSKIETSISVNKESNIFDKLTTIAEAFKYSFISTIITGFKQLEEIQYDYIISKVEKLASVYDKLSTTIGDNVSITPKLNVISPVSEKQTTDVYSLKQNVNRPSVNEQFEKENIELRNQNNQIFNVLKDMLSEFKLMRAELVQPVYIKIGDKTINELTKVQSMKRNMRIGFDNMRE